MQCVCMYELQVDAHVMSEMLLGLAIRRDTVGRNRRSLYNLRQQFQDFAKHQQEQVMETSDQSDEGIVSYYITHERLLNTETT